MKKCLLQIILGLSLSVASYGQTQTLFSGNQSYGGFGGPLLEISKVNGQTVADVGGGGALIINDFFVGGYGLGTEDATVFDLEEEEDYDIDFGHGGFWFGYALNQHKLVHLYTSFRIGWGGVELLQNDDKKYSDNVFVMAPELGVEINVTDWFKLGLSGGYRYVDGINSLPVLSNEDFTGMYGAITFRFGGFGDYGNYSSSNRNDDDDDDDFDF